MQSFSPDSPHHVQYAEPTVTTLVELEEPEYQAQLELEQLGERSEELEKLEQLEHVEHLEQLNSRALEMFIYQPVSQLMVDWLANLLRGIIKCEPCKPGTVPSLEEFIAQLIRCSNVQVATLMPIVIYLQRIKTHLQPKAVGLSTTAHRLFLTALVVAGKALNDSSPKNKHWASYSQMEMPDGTLFGFSLSQVNAMERQMLEILDFDLTFSCSELCEELEMFIAPIRARLELELSTKPTISLEDDKPRADSERPRKQQKRKRNSITEVPAQSSMCLPPTPPPSRGPSRPASAPRDQVPKMQARITHVQEPESPLSMTYSGCSRLTSPELLTPVSLNDQNCNGNSAKLDHYSNSNAQALRNLNWVLEAQRAKLAIYNAQMFAMASRGNDITRPSMFASVA